MRIKRTMLKNWKLIPLEDKWQNFSVVDDFIGHEIESFMALNLNELYNHLNICKSRAISN